MGVYNSPIKGFSKIYLLCAVIRVKICISTNKAGTYRFRWATKEAVRTFRERHVFAVAWWVKVLQSELEGSQFKTC